MIRSEITPQVTDRQVMLDAKQLVSDQAFIKSMIATFKEVFELK